MNFFYSGQYTVVIQHEQCIFTVYGSAGRVRKNFQRLPKVIELKFIISLFLQVKSPTGS